ncbi:MAG: FlgO family outer membrane protein, partial [Blastocatellia bacterium]|nr:FlgO family outer membrane protein [Blastocatellia bacterium]
MSKRVGHLYEFGAFQVDATERVLLCDGERVPLKPKAFDTLLVLVQNSGHILEVNELMGKVWPDAIVEENNLRQSISTLRKVFGDDLDAPRYIETIPRRGYRFMAPVTERWEEPDEVLLVERTRTQVVIHEEVNVEDPESRNENQRSESGAADSYPSPAISLSRLQSSILNPRSSLLGLPVLLLVGVSVAVGLWLWNQSSRSQVDTSVNSIAVLPFKTIGDETEDDYLSLGMADVLITQLSHLRSVVVRPTRAIMKYRESEQDPTAIGQALRVEAVLEGTVQRTADRVRVTARLVNVRDGTALWVGKFDEPWGHVLTVQDAIARQVTNTLGLELSREEWLRVSKGLTANADAYQLYLKGRYSWNKRNDMIKAASYFQQAIEKDPHFALAYVGLADCYIMGDRVTASLGQTAISKALELDPTLGEAYASRGFYLMFQEWRWAEAEQSFRRAMELSPGYATAHQWYAYYLAFHGRLAEAKAAMNRALEIDPLSPNFHADLGQLLYFERQYDQAIAQCRKALSLDPNFWFAHQYLASLYLKTGRHAEALAEIVESYRLTSPDLSNQDGIEIFRRAFELGGIKGLMRAEIGIVKKSSPQPSYFIARNYALLGENNKALDGLEKAYEARHFFMPFISVEPMFDSLR